MEYEEFIEAVFRDPFLAQAYPIWLSGRVSEVKDMECSEHDWTPTNCLKCGGFLGNCCENCLTVSDGGDWMASQTDAWCHCQNPVSDFHFEQDDDDETRDDFHHSNHMDGAE